MEVTPELLAALLGLLYCGASAAVTGSSIFIQLRMTTKKSMRLYSYVYTEISIYMNEMWCKSVGEIIISERVS